MSSIGSYLCRKSSALTSPEPMAPGHSPLCTSMSGKDALLPNYQIMYCLPNYEEQTIRCNYESRCNLGILWDDVLWASSNSPVEKYSFEWTFVSVFHCAAKSYSKNDGQIRRRRNKCPQIFHFLFFWWKFSNFPLPVLSKYERCFATSRGKKYTPLPTIRLSYLAWNSATRQLWHFPA